MMSAPVRSHLAYHQRLEAALVTDVSLLRNPVNLDELNAPIGEPHTTLSLISSTMPTNIPSSSVGAHPIVHWTEGGEARSARRRSESVAPPARRVVIADDHITADDAYGLACKATALLWRGDFQNARQMLLALASRADRRPRKAKKSLASPVPTSPAEAFHRYRQARSQRARTLGALLVPLDADYGIPLRRAPDMRQACAEAYGPAEGPSVASLRALLGLIGAHEWRIKGIEIAAVGGRLNPHTAG